MRTIIETKEVYNYDDLLLPENSELKQKVLEREYDINVLDDWWRDMYEDGQRIGLKIDGFDITYKGDIKGNLLLDSLEVAQNIVNEHGDECDTYKLAINFINEYEPLFISYLDEQSEHYESNAIEHSLNLLESSFTQDLLQCYWKLLYDEYNYQTSEEAILETIQANEYEFTIYGKIYYSFKIIL